MATHMLRSYQVSPAVVSTMAVEYLPPRFHFQWRDEATDPAKLAHNQVGHPAQFQYSLLHSASPIAHYAVVIPNLAKSLSEVGRCSRSTAARSDT